MADTLFVDPVGGIAGDMFLAACLDAGVSPDALRAELAKLGPLGFDLRIRREHEASVAGLHVDVQVEGAQPHERSYVDIVALIERCSLSSRVKQAALRIFRRIGEAEAHVHHKSLEDIHFHEVGAVDSIVDICGAAICLELLDWPHVIATPPPAGSGTIQTAHGLIPVPPPATLEIMRGRTLRASGPGERTTPTGAGILAALSEEVPAMPDLVVERIGYGVGTRRFEDAPNVVRVVLGRRARNHAAKSCVLIETNLDDATGQILARAIDVMLEAGALDAWATPIVAKKGRPAHLVSALAELDTSDAVQRALLAETPSLGLRVTTCQRTVLDREWHHVVTPWGQVRVKVGLDGGRIVNVAPEHDDCLAVAKEAGVPLKRVLQAAAAAAEVLVAVRRGEPET
jgi:uncharacterized protein (TIGR00299 family) protein